uniref:inositol monophosphatase family protein n=1 Tax=Micromonospora acroterricola TaxID=2202421 RepID=UPI0013750A1C|nr:inositol monophosphatase [Micromonospora acroterricola]
MDLDELLTVARRAADAGAQAAMDWRRRVDELTVEEKAGPDDLVSQADREAERAIRAVLAAHRPDDGILGEEDGSVEGSSGIRWIVDPIDGTTNYLYGRPDWAVSVAAARVDGDELLAGVVAEPMVGRTAEAVRGGGAWAAGVRLPRLRGVDLERTLIEVNLGRGDQKSRAGRMVDALVPRVRDVRRGGSAAAALAQLATGRVDAVWLPGLSPWDYAAGVLLVQEVGGRVGDLAGPCEGSWPASGDVLAAPAERWETLRELIAGAYRQ